MAKNKDAIFDYQHAIAVKLRALRADKGVSQAKLSVASGVEQGTIAKIERRGKPLSLTSLYRLAKALGVGAHDILPDTSEDVTEPVTPV